MNEEGVLARPVCVSGDWARASRIDHGFGSEPSALSILGIINARPVEPLLLLSELDE
jgi:hypothetical protein